jgi:hypothetical protein
MLDTANNYATEHRYQLHPQKTVITRMVQKRNNKLEEEPKTWKLAQLEVPLKDNFTHQGKKAPDITSHIRSARRAAYALMKIGLYGVEGLGPRTSLRIIQTYVTPRLLYGLEATVLCKKDLDELDNFYKKLLRQIQALPESTATEAIYLLIGALPVKFLLHIRVLSLFGNICRLPPTHDLHQLARRQIAVRDDNSRSWFSMVVKIAEEYNINVHKQILYPWPKLAWKRHIKEEIQNSALAKLKEDAGTKSSLGWMIIPDNPPLKTHPIWTFSSDTVSLRAAGIRAKMLTGRFQTQSLTAKFYKEESPVCRICSIYVQREKRTPYI